MLGVVGPIGGEFLVTSGGGPAGSRQGSGLTIALNHEPETLLLRNAIEVLISPQIQLVVDQRR